MERTTPAPILQAPTTFTVKLLGVYPVGRRSCSANQSLGQNITRTPASRKKAPWGDGEHCFSLEACCAINRNLTARSASGQRLIPRLALGLLFARQDVQHNPNKHFLKCARMLSWRWLSQAKRYGMLKQALYLVSFSFGFGTECGKEDGHFLGTAKLLNRTRYEYTRITHHYSCQQQQY